MFSKVSKGNSHKAIVSKRKKFDSYRLFFWLMAIVFWLMPIVTNAQCAMCRASLESEDGGNKAAAVNDGIVYLMAFPYLLVGVLGYFVYKTQIKKKK
ncbi:MAG: hypothetical protein ACI7YS_02320 [Flavobacterium sp.]